MPEYINPNTHAVILTGPDGQTIKVAAGQRKMLPEFFERYCSKGYLRRSTGQESTDAQQQRRVASVAKHTPPPAAPLAANGLVRPSAAQAPRMPRRALGVQRERQEKVGKPPGQTPAGQEKAARPQKKILRNPPAPQKIVGRRLNEDATALLQTNLRIHQYPVSNNIGVGILSYNRVGALKRLVDSIRQHTDLRRTTVFISDDGSTDAATKLYLDELAAAGDFVVLRNAHRLGVAGNTNRLMRCLNRFHHCLLLNDDVEVLKAGWDTFYSRGMDSGAVKHFCMRQPGVYGAREGERMTLNGIEMTHVGEKPHGAVLAYTSDVVQRIGYFDERFGIYGMEHVDWSGRVSGSGMQPAGYFDIVGSHNYFCIHKERSAVEYREKHLLDAKKLIEDMDPGRGYVEPGSRSAVPAISCVIPCRDRERHGGIASVIAGIRGQKFPVIEIIVVEHDTGRKLPDSVGPIKHLVAQSDGRPFNKSRAFNAGVAIATTPYLMLHDADMLLPAGYAQLSYDTLQAHEAGHFGKTVIYLTQQSSAQVNRTGIVDTETACERVVGYFEGGSLISRRSTYWKVGAFNEDFWGYGVEDCEFYERLMRNSNWKDHRHLDFVHIWHGRSDGWMQEHNRNKELGKHISSTPMLQRIQDRYAALRQAGYADQLEAALKGMI